MNAAGPILLALMLAMLPGASARAQSGASIEHDAAVLQGLDKVTATISRLTVPIEQTHQFGTLNVTVRACRETPPEEPPESAAFVQIWEVMPGEEPQWAFSGWMFASSPALSALDHPVYDIWVLDCVTAPTAEPGSAADSAATPDSAPAE